MKSLKFFLTTILIVQIYSMKYKSNAIIIYVPNCEFANITLL